VIVLVFAFVCHWCLLVSRAVFWPSRNVTLMIYQNIP